MSAILDLPSDGRMVRTVEQRIRKVRHDQQRHQVLEHRAAPTEQCRELSTASQQSAEGEPVLLVDLSLCNGDETCQPSFGCEQVIATAVHAPIAYVVAGKKQLSRWTVEKSEVHLCQLLGLVCKLLQPSDLVACIFGCIANGLCDRVEPCDNVGRPILASSRLDDRFDLRQLCRLKFRDRIQARRVIERVLNRSDTLNSIGR